MSIAGIAAIALAMSMRSRRTESCDIEYHEPFVRDTAFIKKMKKEETIKSNIRSIISPEESKADCNNCSETYTVEDCSEMDAAARDGNLEKVQHLYSIGKNFSETAVEDAAAQGYLDIVKFLCSVDKKCSAYAINAAAGNGHLGVVRYLHTIGVICTEHAMEMAAKNGHLEVVKYLHEEVGIGSIDDALRSAINNMQFDMVEYLYIVSKGCPVAQMTDADKTAYVKLIEYIQTLKGGKSKTESEKSDKPQEVKRWYNLFW